VHHRYLKEDVLNIGLVAQEYPPETAKGGIGTQTQLKARGLAALGHQVRVISRSTEAKRTERNDGAVRIIRTPSTSMAIHTELADWLSYSQRVAEEIAVQHALEPFDILDFPEWACEGYVHLLNQSEWSHVPSVIHLHGPLVMLGRTLGWPDPASEFFRIGTQMEAASLRLADAVFSSSDCSADWCADGYGLDRARIPRLHTGIDTSLFRPLPVPKASSPTVLFVGKLVRNKGVEALTDAACEVAKDFPDLRLRLVGRGEDSVVNLLRSKVAKHGLESLLELAGFVRREDLPQELSRAHLFAAPSQYEGGPGFVYLEAMACGLPVIGCRGSGAAEVIRHQHNGLLVDPDDVAALADALRTLLGDPSASMAMGHRAKRFVAEEADTRRCVAEIARFYERVVADRQALVTSR
jgi:glycosyltransferase involved in cell wall biosynthesis